ncbi:DNA-binding GntR family transcriptional regulator [Saccharothrix tamanrassetensis]|uniref:DNA-binding GntR family transcriptional regulator n=1 Tax=Saccharothrix tamanrassetensis TaxID=1051531 RepID=A0A841CPX0_9PSEU|nr:GntR family transcriptional regulator [Saccharothrix tamanrassetensis]MBB5958045.1 DNA-binding GntR family transcriptional regulator [Saccharothrix tamanrassetensis]
MNSSNIGPVEKVNLRERVAHALRAAVISGEMEPGVVYSAPSLGARFGVSATPVREAMLDLVRENLVVIVPNKGFRVTEVSERDLDEMAQLRMLIEPPIVRDVASVIPEHDFEGLRGLAQRIVDGAEAGDLVEYTEADRLFHLALLGYADNARMVDLVSDLRAHTRLYGLASLLEKGELVPVAREHLAIVDALRSRDAARAEELLRAHISQTRGRWAKPS